MSNQEKEVRARVADLIRQQYRARGIKRGDFAKELGITERTVGYWQDGTSIPKGSLQNEIEEMFGWQKGAIAGAIADGLSGKPLEEIRIASASASVAALEDVPASELADELLARLRSADDQVRALKRELDNARRQLTTADVALAAHGIEDSMLERFQRDRLLREAQEGTEAP